MDPVVLQLLTQMAQAKGGNRNLSGTLNNMDNPLLLALAGVLDPMSGQGAGQSSGIYNQFANDPNTPATVQQVMDWVDQGLNKYQIESMVTQLPDAVVMDGGYTKKQLVSMANDMTKQRSTGADKNVFEKAGFRNPNDVYGLEDVPLNANNQKMIYDIQQEGKTGSLGSEAKAQKATSALAKLRAGTSVMSPEASKKLAKELDWTKPNAQDMQVFDPNKGFLYALREKLLNAEEDVNLDEWTKNITESNTKYGGLGLDKELLKKQVAKLTKKGQKYAQTKYTKPLSDAYDKAMFEKVTSEGAATNARRQEEAAREGVLQAYAEMGRTPFTDQASQLMRFIAGTK
jgi:hypothetical protein